MKSFPWISLGLLGVIALVSLAAPLLPLPDPAHMDVANRLAPPSAAHWLGQDEFGRDVLSRLIWGGRVSLSVALAATAIACVLGTALGILGAFLRGGVELITVRALEIVLCLPPMLLALLVVTLMGPGITTLIFVLSVLYTPRFGRIAYGSVVAIRSREYVEAMRVLGASSGRTMLRTVLPNISGPVLTQISLAASSAIVLESGLSFLGVGIVPPFSSWGVMIRGARATMEQVPLLLLWPCAMLTLTILTLNAICDGILAFMTPQPQAMAAQRRATAQLVAGQALPAPVPDALLDVRDLSIDIRAGDQTYPVVRDVSFQVRPGETLAIVGESGSGKTLTGLAIMGLLPGAAEVRGGAVRFHGRELLDLDEDALRAMRGKDMAMIFQDPLSSLNPVHRVGRQIEEAIRVHRRPGERDNARERSRDLIRRVGINDPDARARAFPHELSGGMRQRIGIAAAIANRPRLVVADEPTSALDVTIQAQILDLLGELKDDTGLALIIITHSLPVVAEIADRVAVMYAGDIVEVGTVEEVFRRPRHPYTTALLSSVPAEDGPKPKPIGGQVPPLHALPEGCRFAPRCALCTDGCDKQPPLTETDPGRLSRCFRWAEAS